MKEIKLPSGAILKVGIAPFADGRDLYQSVLAELTKLKISASDEIDTNLFKDIFCTILSSKAIESKIWKCAEKSLYNTDRIKEETFEPVDARQDYLEVMFHIAKENIGPFVKALYAQYGHLWEGISTGLKQK